MINAKCVFECVPEKYNGVMGCSTNVLILWYGLICTFIGLSITSDKEQMKFDENWRVVYASPLFFVVL